MFHFFLRVVFSAEMNTTIRQFLYDFKWNGTTYSVMKTDVLFEKWFSQNYANMWCKRRTIWHQRGHDQDQSSLYCSCWESMFQDPDFTYVVSHTNRHISASSKFWLLENNFSWNWQSSWATSLDQINLFFQTSLNEQPKVH